MLDEQFLYVSIKVVIFGYYKLFKINYIDLCKFDKFEDYIN